MSSVYAVVENGVVTNLVQWDGQTKWQPPEGAEAIAVPDGVFIDIGYAWDGTAFNAPRE
jgi:hypothetical protein